MFHDKAKRTQQGNLLECVSTTGRGVFRYPNFWSTFFKNIADSLGLELDSENCHDYNLMTKPWWLRYDDCARLGFDPGSRSCHSPSTPSHSLCDQTSANCISSLMLKCICNQHELYLFTHAQVYLCTISSFMIKCILLIHDEVYLCNSASCIFSLMLKCICNQYKP